MKLTGLSLSFCIKDILSGNVKEEDVERIISNTRFPDIMMALDDQYHYTKIYWKLYAKAEIEALLTKLKDKIEQPRIEDKDHCHNISEGYWMTRFDGFGYEGDPDCSGSCKALGEIIEVRPQFKS